jgi:hypothetical protein
VIFYDITGIQRHGFLQIISIYQNLTSIFNSGSRNRFFLTLIKAIDAPLKLAMSDKPNESNIRNMESQWPMVYTYRPWEYLIFEKLRKEYGISGRPFSSLTITNRAQVLRRLVERRGWKLVSSPDQITGKCFTEVFPNLTMGILGPACLHTGPCSVSKTKAANLS